MVDDGRFIAPSDLDVLAVYAAAGLGCRGVGHLVVYVVHQVDVGDAVGRVVDVDIMVVGGGNGHEVCRDVFGCHTLARAVDVVVVARREVVVAVVVGGAAQLEVVGEVALQALIQQGFNLGLAEAVDAVLELLQLAQVVFAVQLLVQCHPSAEQIAVAFGQVFLVEGVNLGHQRVGPSAEVHVLVEVGGVVKQLLHQADVHLDGRLERVVHTDVDGQLAVA